VPTIEERFWAKVDRSGPCWLWTAAQRRGYGYFRDGNRMIPAHRWAYTHFIANPGELHVLHTCDVPLCVTLDHLWLGTNLDNMRDKLAKGRAVHPPTRRGFVIGRGEKLTAAQVLDIRARSTGIRGEKTRLAEEFGVSRRAIAFILDGTNWPI
jgi:hypothetical protein